MKIKLSKSQWESIGKKTGWMKSASKVTKEDIDYQAAPYGHIATIPAGTPVEPAINLPQGGYWVESWAGMDEKAQSWKRNYGFHVEADEVVEN